VTFALTNGPSGAKLSGNTIAWTPAAEQSRIPDNFTVTATASGGASATQSWTVTPSGTVRISRVDTLWNETGSTTKPFDWSSIASNVAALVPQPDGSFQTLSGTAGANGTFEIPNVPAGYYWLKIGSGVIYWTSSSTFDMGSDSFVPAAGATRTTSTATTSFNFHFTSLDPVNDLLQVDALESGFPTYVGPANASVAYSSNVDFSSIKTLFARQYEPASFGSINGYVMGPELTLSNQSLTVGGTNNIGGALNPAVPASINLSIQGSAWAPLFNHVAPTATGANGGAFYLSVQPYIAADGPNVFLPNQAMPINLISADGGFSGLFAPTCPANPSLASDVDAGTVQYSDPFPANWRRIFRVCQTASVVIPLPGGHNQGIILTNTQTTSLPTATVKPMLSSVQNPKINGADLFTAATVNPTAVTLSWDAPAIGTPYGYNVSVLSPTTLPGGGITYQSSTTLSTAKTSMTIPPGVLASGQTYLFIVRSLADGKTNVETSPLRSALPTAGAEIVSAPITTN
jgi:hypothetical protein